MSKITDGRAQPTVFEQISPELSISVVPQESSTEVFVNGCFDAYNAPALEDRVDKILGIAKIGETLSFNLSRVEFLALSGVRSMLKTKEKCREKAVFFSVIDPSRPATKLINLLNIYTVDEIEVIQTS